MAKKVFVIGIDQMILPLTKILADQGCIPNIKKLIDNGASNQALPSFPAWTTTNWATISTGADTGTHGVFSWLIDMPNGKTVSPFHSAGVNAETIWEAAEKQGLKSAVIHYPASMPSKLKEGYVIDGDATPEFGGSRYEITPSETYTNIEGITGTSMVKLCKAEGWISLPQSSSIPLESNISIIPKFKGDEKNLKILVYDSQGKGYDTIAICEKSDFSEKIVEVKKNEWSDWVFENFVVGGENKTGTFRFKLVELSADSNKLRLYRSQVMPTTGFSDPDSIGKELIDELGPYQEHVSEFPYLLGATDLETCLEEAEYHTQWIAKAAKYLVYNKDCSIFFCHLHYLDDINHHHLAQIDPSWPSYNEEKSKKHWDIIKKVYAVIDRMVGTILDGIDEETYVVMVSDHGNEPSSRLVYMEKYLYNEGLLKVKDPTLPLSIYHDSWWDNLDWDKTKTYMKPGEYEDPSIYINAKGEEYNKIKKELLVKLRTWVDEETGNTPIAIALSKADAAVLGLWGDSIGDVVPIMESGYSSWTLPHDLIGKDPVIPVKGVLTAAHGRQLITAQSTVSSHLALFIINGKNIKKGYSRPPEKLGYIKLMDVTPTLCKILGIEPPAQSQGTVAKDIFEGYEMIREKTSVEIKEKEIDERVVRQEHGMHDFSLLKKFPWEDE